MNRRLNIIDVIFSALCVLVFLMACLFFSGCHHLDPRSTEEIYSKVQHGSTIVEIRYNGPAPFLVERRAMCSITSQTATATLGTRPEAAINGYSLWINRAISFASGIFFSRGRI